MGLGIVHLQYNPTAVPAKTEGVEPGTVAFKGDWCVLHAAVFPCHRDLVGFTGAGPSPEHPEYLVARRGKHLSLNLIDAVVEVDFPRELFDTALRFLHEGVQSGDPVLIHCNQGVSRSAGIGLLYLHRHTDVLPAGDYEQAARFYEREVYPHFNPGKAIRHFLKLNWDSYGPDSA